MLGQGGDVVEQGATVRADVALAEPDAGVRRADNLLQVALVVLQQMVLERKLEQILVGTERAVQVLRGGQQYLDDILYQQVQIVLVASGAGAAYATATITAVGAIHHPIGSGSVCVRFPPSGKVARLLQHYTQHYTVTTFEAYCFFVSRYYSHGSCRARVDPGKE